MKERFISSRPLGVADLLINAFSPLVSSGQNRVVLHNRRRQDYSVAVHDGPVGLDPRAGYDVAFNVRRAAQRTVLTVDCGIAEDVRGREYVIACRVDLGFTIRDDAAAIERVLRDFDAEFAGFCGVMQSRLRSLVRILLRERKAMHGSLDVDRCQAGLEQAAHAADLAFAVVQVHHGTFGDPGWSEHPVRQLRVEELDAEDQLGKRLKALQREEIVVRAAQPLLELQREYAQRAEDFRRLLDRAEAEHKLAKIRAALADVGPEAAIALIDPVAHGLIAAHRERLGDQERQMLQRFNDELVVILRKRLF